MGPNKYLHYPAVAPVTWGQSVFLSRDRGEGAAHSRPQTSAPLHFSSGQWRAASSRGKFAELSTSFEEHM